MRKRYSLALVILLAAVLAAWHSGRNSKHGLVAKSLPTSAASAAATAQAKSSDRKLSSAVPESSEELISKRRLASLIRSDRYCGAEIQRLETDEKLRENPTRSALLYRALLEAGNQGDADPCALALFSRGTATALAYSRQGSGIVCRFILGTSLTGQWMSGMQTGKTNPEQKAEGAAILKQLAYENPGNGFFAFYALNALEKDDRAGQEEFYLLLLRAEKFEDPYLPILEQLKELGHLNPTAYMLTSDLVSFRGAPEQNPGEKYARALASEGLYPQDFAAWAGRNAENVRQIDAAGLTEPWVNLLEQTIIRSITVAGSRKLGIDYSIYDLERWRGFFRRRLFPNDITGFVSQEASCTELVETVRKLQARLSSDDDRQISLRL